jgi:hypothetical protein
VIPFNAAAICDPADVGVVIWTPGGATLNRTQAPQTISATGTRT